MEVARDNATWIRDLRTSGTAPEAITDLRRLLLRGLTRSLQTWHQVDEAFVEDVVQQAIMTILDRLDQFAGRSRFTTWAMAIAVRTAMSELRRKHWQDVSLESLTNSDNLEPALAVDNSLDLNQQVEQRVLFEVLRRLIDTELTEKQWAAITAELDGMPVEEIARRTGSNVNAVYKLLHDARNRLKRGLEDAGYAAADVQSAFTSARLHPSQ